MTTRISQTCAAAWRQEIGPQFDWRSAETKSPLHYLEDKMTPNEITDTRLFVLQRAVMALINTHPNPRDFAKAFSSITAQQQVDQAAFAKSKPEALKESNEFASEIIEWAVRVADARDASRGSAGR